MRKCAMLTTAAMCAVLLTSCAAPSEQAMKPMMGLEWYTGYDDVKSELSGYTLLGERENPQTAGQKMQDYENVVLFDTTCDLTLCFTDAGLIGFNYHDIDRSQNYRAWHTLLETEYGLPTEEGTGMASWYDDPVGKNTAIYLFNLEEGVQVSIYATADSPDRSYRKGEKRSAPTPELRTPIVPVTETEPTASAPGETESAVIAESTAAETLAAGERREETVTAGIPTETVSAGSEPETRPLPATDVYTDRSREFLLNGLAFYGSPDSERRKMSSFTQRYEYRTEEPGQPWELIMEYGDVPYDGKNCDMVLCFTSRGLVGVNYTDSDAASYSDWVERLKTLYGTPSETQYDYTAWSSAPVGEGTMVYVFALADGVQISFFADDTGSELAE